MDHARRHPPIRSLTRPVAGAWLAVVFLAAAALPMGARAADPTPDPNATPSSPVAEPAPTPTPSPSPVATLEPTPTPSPSPGPTTGPTPQPTPSPTPSPAPTPTPTPSPTGPTPIGASTTFYGRGYGHGVGLSQHGARGRALAGQTAAQILGHYYRGTTLGSIPLTTPIRVRVLSGFRPSSTSPLVLHARRAGWRFEGIATLFPADARVEVRPALVRTATGTTVTWRVRVISATGALLRSARTGTFRLRGATASTVFQVDSRPSAYDTYRGGLRVGLTSTSTAISVTNEVSIERYLRGVVAAEMAPTWPTEALRAQSIAARSFAAHRLRPGSSYYDVTDDTASQVYLGLEGERPATTAAVDATAGVVVTSGSSIANTLFHSAGGGATEDNQNVFVSPTGARVATAVTYLQGSSDRRADGSPYDSSSPYATWQTATYSRTQLSAWFGSDARTAVGTLQALDLRARGVSGRLIRVTLIGTLGSRTVSGDVFRAIFNAHRPAADPMLRSTLFDTRPVP